MLLKFGPKETDINMEIKINNKSNLRIISSVPNHAYFYWPMEKSVFLKQDDHFAYRLVERKGELIEFTGTELVIPLTINLIDISL